MEGHGSKFSSEARDLVLRYERRAARLQEIRPISDVSYSQRLDFKVREEGCQVARNQTYCRCIL
jgi:hypothetical protein